MNLRQRIELFVRLGNYMRSDEKEWILVKEKAGIQNRWFITEFVDLAINNIATAFLRKETLLKWVEKYNIPNENNNPKIIGIVMAGNIPLVGFHDLLCVFITGHKTYIKLSSKDDVLIKHLVDKIQEWDLSAGEFIRICERLNNCDAYIATGSNNSSRYFEYYFGKYPHIIRRNKTSVAVISGAESPGELEKLSDDIFQYFGLGCRNVTKLYVPEDYDFVSLLSVFKKYSYLADHNKYKNNYDYNLAIHMLNNRFYMTNGSVLLVEEKSLFSPVSQLNFEFYTDRENVLSSLNGNSDVQCIIGKDGIPFGNAQCPSIIDYADGIDTVNFLLGTRISRI
jgi:hypothetical protein